MGGRWKEQLAGANCSFLSGRASAQRSRPIKNEPLCVLATSADLRRRMQPTKTEPGAPLSPPTQPDAVAPHAAAALTSATTTAPDSASTFATPTKRVWSDYLINRNFAVLWAGQALSILGDMV